MASAGRILIMPKGTYNASTTYEMLDMVGYNGTTWLAKKTVKNIEPSDANSEFWQNMFNATADSLGAISRTGYGRYIGNVDELKQAGTYVVVGEYEDTTGTFPINANTWFTVDVSVGGTGSVTQTWYLNSEENVAARVFIRHFNGHYWGGYLDTETMNQRVSNLESSLTTTRTDLDNRTNSRLFFNWDDAGALQLFVDGTYYGTVKFIDK